MRIFVCKRFIDELNMKFMMTIYLFALIKNIPESTRVEMSISGLLC